MARRTRTGLGSVCQTAEGTWRAEIWVAGRRVTKRYAKKWMAERWLREMRIQKVEVESGATEFGRDGAAEKQVTYAELGAALLRWWEVGQDRRRTDGTRRSYRNALTRVLEWWGPRQVARTTPADIEEWFRSMRAAGRASSTLRNLGNVLSQLHQTGVRLKLLRREPCAVVRPAPVIRSERKATTEDDLERLLSWPDLTIRQRAAILLGADAGLRPAETARLLLTDVVADEGGQLWLHLAVRDDVDRTKSGRGRYVPVITERLRSALEAVAASAPSGRLLGVESYESLRWLLTPLYREALGTSPQLHALRHRFGTRAAAVEPLPKVQAWMGHSDPKTTMVYVHAGVTPASGTSDALAPIDDFHRLSTGGRGSVLGFPRGRSRARSKDAES